MACYHPIKAYYSKFTNASGSRSVVFNLRDALDDRTVTLACGSCIGCRLERSRQWAVRCLHESQMHQSNVFLTLTYSPENLPKDGSLNKKDFQNFMKKLRKKFPDQKLKYYMCGEYGEKNLRPHYHVCLFGLDFPDKKLWKTYKGQQYFTSETLNKIWQKGYAVIGDVTFESAAYVARYISKKITGKKSLDHYTQYNKETGEIISELLPEYNDMSRREGIGLTWIKKFFTDVYPSDQVIVNGRPCRPPKYYDKLLEKWRPMLLDEIKDKRRLKALDHTENNTHDRLMVREQVQISKFKKLLRSMESEL